MTRSVPSEASFDLAPAAHEKPLRASTLAAALLLVGALVIMARLPIALDFKMFALYDPGAALKADALLSAGQRPTVDFAYSYGLLPLWLAHGWYKLIGRTPIAHQTLLIGAQAALLLAMVALGSALGWRRRSLVVATVALPIALTEVYLNQTHILEAALLSWALVQQARGRRRWALALATVAAFAKPSMAYAYGLMLLTLIVGEWWKRRRERTVKQEMVRALWPAAAAAVLLGAILGSVFGRQALMQTLFPLNVRASYEAADFGFFFGVGRTFWWRPNGDYFTSIAAFWIACTLLITGGAIWWLGRRVALTPQLAAGVAMEGVLSPAAGARRETFLCMVAMHLVFVIFFYAWEGSWSYYAYLLVLAAATATGWAGQKTGRVVALALCTLLAVAMWRQPIDWAFAWRRVRGPETAGLWGYPAIVEDCTWAREATAGREALWMVNGDLEEMFSGIRTPACWFMGPAFLTPGEVEKIRGQIRQARWVVRYQDSGFLDPWTWPEFREEAKGFRAVAQSPNGYLTIEERVTSTQPAR